MSVIYLHSLFPISSSGLPSDVGRATLINAGLHDLTTPKMYSATCHHVPGGLLLHLLTLTAPRSGGYFLLHYSALADSFLLGSRMLYVARTFLFCHRHQRQTVRLLLWCKDSDIFLVWHMSPIRNWNLGVFFRIFCIFAYWHAWQKGNDNECKIVILGG